MHVYLIRHGESENKSYSGKDFDRRLTENGIVILRSAAEQWKPVIRSIDLIISSPLIRAVESANIIRDVFKVESEVIKDSRMSPGGHTLNLIDIALEHDKEAIAFVGHQPDCSEHISLLTSMGGSSVNFGTGTIAGINFSGRIRLTGGVLEFLIPSSIGINPSN